MRQAITVPGQPQRLASLRHYVLLAQDAPRVEMLSRAGDLWRFDEVEGRAAVLPLEALGIALPLGELYEGIAFAADLAAAAQS